ncbi:MAG: hypothetical protein HYT37_01155 [Candidatus Sungbacteria bacterium]|nr:hypothetical protein [Candidatus Sungbacteria bacterium]
MDLPAPEQIDMLAEGRNAWMEYTNFDQSGKYKDEHLALSHFILIGDILCCMRGEVIMALHCAENGLLPLTTDDEIAAFVLQLQKIGEYDFSEGMLEDCLCELHYDYESNSMQKALAQAAKSLNMSVEEYEEIIHKPVMEKINAGYSLSPEDEAEMHASNAKRERIENVLEKVLQMHLDRVKSGT